MAKKRYTIDGISVEIDERVFSDMSTVEMLIYASKPLPDEDDENYNQIATERGEVTLKLFDLILGNEKQKVLDAIRKKNDGFAEVSVVFDWLNKLMSKSNAAKK